MTKYLVFLLSFNTQNSIYISSMATSAKDYTPVRKEIAAILKQPQYDDGSAGPVLVR